MPAAPIDLSPVAAATAVLAAVFGPQVLPFASAYSVIGAGALVGAVIALYRRAPCSALASVVFVLVMWAASMGCTVSVAQWISNWLNQPLTWLFFPVSLAVAAVGEDWLKLPFGPIVAKALGLIQRTPKEPPSV